MESSPLSEKPAPTTLRVAINSGTVDGPFGGANRFAKSFAAGMEAAGHYLTSTLEPNLDVLLIVISHDASRATFTYKDAAAYKCAYPKAVVVQRINACDEQRGGSASQNEAILNTNKIADHTVFVSQFMERFWKEKGIGAPDRQSVILNGSDRTYFHPKGHVSWDSKRPLKLVTHHWSSNYLKGFDVYQRLDEMLATDPWRSEFEMTFIGNTPPGFALKNTKVLPPLDNTELANELRSHHGYLTASRLEPGGNHYTEAMQCGLPVLHLNSGSLPEYCSEFGLTFTLSTFEEQLGCFRASYEDLRQKVLDCPYDAVQMVQEYVALLERLRRGKSAPDAKNRPISFQLHQSKQGVRRLMRRIGNKLVRLS